MVGYSHCAGTLGIDRKMAFLEKFNRGPCEESGSVCSAVYDKTLMTVILVIHWIFHKAYSNYTFFHYSELEQALNIKKSGVDITHLKREYGGLECRCLLHWLHAVFVLEILKL